MKSLCRQLSVAIAMVCFSFPVTHAAELQSEEARKYRRGELRPCYTLGVTRTFLDVSVEQLGWSDTDWIHRFKDLRNLGFSEVILEYSSNNELEYFLRSMPDNVDRSPIGAMTRAAAQTGMRVWMGLHRASVAADDDRIGLDELSDALDARLEKIQDRLYPLLLSILAADPNGTVYRGWYLPEVINSEGWIDPDRHQLLVQYLYSLHKMLGQLQPEWPVMISASLNRFDVDVDRLIVGWKRLASSAGASVFLLEVSESVQVDDDELMQNQASDWLKRISDGLESEQLRFGATIRLFRSADNGQQVRAASFSRLRESLNSVRQIGQEPLTVFPIPRHLLQKDDRTTKSLRSRWIRDQKACRGTPSRLVQGPDRSGEQIAIQHQYTQSNNALTLARAQRFE